MKANLKGMRHTRPWINLGIVAIAVALLTIGKGGIGWSKNGNAQPAFAQSRLAHREVLFRTPHYVVQLYWRGDQPYLTVSHNGFRVIVNQRAQILSPRSATDPWMTYACNAGDYQAAVRVTASGQRMIEVSLNRRVIAQEYAQSVSPLRPAPPTGLLDAVLLDFQTHEYAVKVYQQQGKPYLNLYNRQSKKTELQQAPVHVLNLAEAVIYQYEGAFTLQARESVHGSRSLLILRDNDVQYRGEGY